jgi:hypothetical protein
MKHAELLIVEAGGTYSYHWALKGKVVYCIRIMTYSASLAL